MNSKVAPIHLVDCTLRDGSYQIDFGFTADQTRELVAALEHAGVAAIEVGHGLGLGAPASGRVTSAESDEVYMRAAREGATGAQVGVFAMGAFATEDDVAMAADLGMDFIRIGVDAANHPLAEGLVRAAVSRGMHTTVFLMKSYSLDVAVLASAAPAFEDWGAHAAYVVDSAGGMTPSEVSAYVRAIVENTNLTVGFHGHNNLQLAAANALAAVEAGATQLDASLRGLGRSSGNAQIEALAVALIRSGYSVAADPVELCAVAERFIVWPELHGGVETVDLVQGMARVHSGMQARIDKVAALFGLDSATLTLAVGKAGNGLDLSDEQVMDVAQGLAEALRLGVRAAG